MVKQVEGERRPFLKQGWNWIKIVSAVVLCYPLFRFLHFQVPRKPRLEKVTQKLNPGDVYLAPDFALFLDKNRAWAVSRTCTHLGCRLNYSEEEHLLICPCHHSKFTVDGKRIAGPAQRDLSTFPVEKMSGESEQGYIVTL